MIPAPELVLKMRRSFSQKKRIRFFFFCQKLISVVILLFSYDFYQESFGLRAALVFYVQDPIRQQAAQNIPTERREC